MIPGEDCMYRTTLSNPCSYPRCNCEVLHKRNEADSINTEDIIHNRVLSVRNRLKCGYSIQSIYLGHSGKSGFFNRSVSVEFEGNVVEKVEYKVYSTDDSFDPFNHIYCPAFINAMILSFLDRIEKLYCHELL